MNQTWFKSGCIKILSNFNGEQMGGYVISRKSNFVKKKCFQQNLTNFYWQCLIFVSTNIGLPFGKSGANSATFWNIFARLCHSMKTEVQLLIMTT